MERSRNICLLFNANVDAKHLAPGLGKYEGVDCDLLVVCTSTDVLTIDHTAGSQWRGAVSIAGLADQPMGDFCKQSLLSVFEDGYEHCVFAVADSAETWRESLGDVFLLLNDGVQVVLKSTPDGKVVCLGLGGVYLECLRDVPWGTSAESMHIERQATLWHRSFRRL